DVGCAVDAGADLAHADALQREQVTLGYHADGPALGVDDDEVLHTVGRHFERRIVGRGGGRNRMRVGGHQTGDSGTEIGGGQHDARVDVRLGNDADRLLVVVHDQHAADA